MAEMSHEEWLEWFKEYSINRRMQQFPMLTREDAEYYVEKRAAITEEQLIAEIAERVHHSEVARKLLDW